MVTYAPEITPLWMTGMWYILPPMLRKQVRKFSPKCKIASTLGTEDSVLQAEH